MGVAVDVVERDDAMGETLTQIGVGGVFALLVIREVLSFLKSRKNGSTKLAGELTSDYWQAEQRKATSEIIIAIVVPILSNQTAILNELRIEHGKVSQSLAIVLDRMVEGRGKS